METKKMGRVCNREGDGQLHVVPVNDLRDHVTSVDCWCCPIDDDGIIVHNSLDGREKYENGEPLN